MPVKALAPPRLGDPLISGCLATLRALGPAVSAELVAGRGPGAARDERLKLKLGAKGAPLTLTVRSTRTHLSYALAAGFSEEARRAGGHWLLFAPYVPGAIGRHLAERQVSYVDAVGNCHIQAGQTLVAHVEGKKPARATAGGGGRVPSYQLLFAILAKPSLLDTSVRQVALVAGVGKTAAAEQLKRLNDQGLLQRTSAGTTLVRRRELFDRWLAAYAEVVRPSWLVGRYRPQLSDPLALEAHIERTLEKQVWAFGAGAAAFRMQKFYRGPETVLHVSEVPSDLPKKLKAIAAPDGPLIVLHTPGSVAYEGARPHLAHPLLVYTELLNSSDPRMVEAANELRDLFLKEQQ